MDSLTEIMCPPYPADVLPELERLLQERRLAARFQPVITLEDGGLLGFEGLIRGPSDSSLHAPLVLFDAARRLGFHGIHFTDPALLRPALRALGLPV